MSVMGAVDRALGSAFVDDMWIESESQATAHTLVRDTQSGLLPLVIVRHAVGQLVAHVRGAGWSVAVHEVAVLRIFRPAAADDFVTTTITCRPAGSDELVVSARCLCDDTLIATVTARLTARREASR